MKIVVDTNVLVSGIFWSGTPNKILNLWIDDKVELFISKRILTEYLRVITELADKFNRPALAHKWISLILENTTLIEAPAIHKESSDPDDNKFIDCTVASNADYLVSGDKHLLILKEVCNVQIVLPSTFLKIYNLL